MSRLSTVIVDNRSIAWTVKRTGLFAGSSRRLEVLGTGLLLIFGFRRIGAWGELVCDIFKGRGSHNESFCVAVGELCK
jgi:hypothetical protein